MHLLLIRHGQSDGNLAGRLQGWQDAPLTPLGERQAALTAAALRAFLDAEAASVAAVYSSPLQRAARTAALIGTALGRPVTLDSALREMNFGHIEGLTEAEWRDRYPELLTAAQVRENLDFGWPGGETRRGFYARILGALTAIVARHADADYVVVVAHGALIASYLSFVSTGAWHHWGRFTIGNCSITHLTLAPDGASAEAVACLLTVNDLRHLAEAEIPAGPT